MKLFTKILIAVLLLTGFGFSSPAYSQAANTNQLGIRLGSFTGITFRHINSRSTGFEADLLMNDGIEWGMVSVLFEKHLSLGQGFVFNFGGGGFFAGNYNHRYGNDNGVALNPAAGLETVLGFEYYLPDVPLSAGVDMRPRFSVVSDPLWVWDAGIVIHYIF